MTKNNIGFKCPPKMDKLIRQKAEEEDRTISNIIYRALKDKYPQGADQKQ